MKRNDEKAGVQTTSSSRQDQGAEITSASVENAHATGDGAVKKTDELISSEENEDDKKNNTPY